MPLELTNVFKEDAGSIAAMVIRRAMEIHSKIGPGRLASAYAKSLAEALSIGGLQAEPLDLISAQLRGKRLTRGPCPPLLVGGTVLVESKSLLFLSRVHRKQMLTYLKLSRLHHGLVINFGGQHLGDNIQEVENPATQRSLLPPIEREATLA